MRKIKTPNYQTCVRCEENIKNPFSKHRVCDDCLTAIQLMTFNGEEVLDMLFAVLPPVPPTPKMQVPVSTVARIVRKILVAKDLILPDDEQDEPPKPSLILTR
jgi:hypothetical protein